VSDKISRETVMHIAALARLRVDERELEALTRRMGEILTYIARLEERDLDAVEPTCHAVDLPGALRQDLPAAGLRAAQALANAPDKAAPYFKVPKVIEGGGDA